MMRMMIVTVVGMAAMASVAGASAARATGARSSAATAVPMDDDDPQSGAVYRASGRHECYAGSSIHHTCDVEGDGYRDCDEARAALVKKDCCPDTDRGGRSVDFLNFTCTPM